MIICKLKGGLGNQMFQYAAARNLSLLNNTGLLLDTSYLKKDSRGAYTKREFELSCFNFKYKILTSWQELYFKVLYVNKYTRFFVKKLPTIFKYNFEVEKSFEYQIEFEQFSENTILDGYWQSEKYFHEISNEIRKEFIFHQKIVDSTIKWRNLMENKKSVSLHVRRGDYVSLKNANDFYYQFDIEYFTNAVSYIQNAIGEFQLFVFSDDIPWCKENFKFDLTIEFVETNNPHRDLYLMTQCKHNIIANSSFSWWGAWLNNNPNKIVLAPKQWFANTDVNTKDVIPEKWIKL